MDDGGLAGEGGWMRQLLFSISLYFHIMTSVSLSSIIPNVTLPATRRLSTHILRKRCGTNDGLREGAKRLGWNEF
jgi:hypothetical protein